MQHSRTPSTASGASTGEGTEKGKSSSSNGGVISKVLGSLRNSSHDGSVVADNNETSNWAEDYEITHRPDRPRRDKREDARNRSSTDVMGQLNRMWQRSQQMAEAKRKLKEAKGGASFAQQPTIQSHRRGGSESAPRSDRPEGDVVGVSSLQTDLVPNFSRKADSPGFSKPGWRAEGEENAERAGGQGEGSIFWRPGSSRSTVPPSPGQMTIRVGLELSGPFGEDESGAYDTVSLVSPTPPPVPKVFTPLTAPPGPTTVFLSPATYVPDEETRGGRVRSQPPRPPADSLTTHRATKKLPALPGHTQTPEAQSRVSRRSTNALYINIDRDDSTLSTPSLTFSDSSSSVSEQLGPQTQPSSGNNIDVASEKKRRCAGHRASSQDPKWCPMPSCGKPLLAPEDRDQNLCAACRIELQPRESTFTTPTDQNTPSPELLRPTVYSPPKTTTKRVHNSSDDDDDDHSNKIQPIVSETTKKRARMPETFATTPTSRYINGDGKPKSKPRPADDHSRSSPYVVVDTSRAATSTASPLPPPSPSPRRKRSGSAKTVSSRFNKDRAGYGLSRRHTRKGRDVHASSSSPNSPRITTQQISPASPRRDNDDDNKNEEELRGARNHNHIGFQLAGWQISPTTPSPTLPSPPLTPPPTTDLRQRRLSGPLLEPKTFRPPTPPPPPTRQPKKENPSTSTLRRKPSASRIRGKAGKSPTNGSSNSGAGGTSPRSPIYRRNKLVPSPPTYRRVASKPDITNTTTIAFGPQPQPAAVVVNENKNNNKRTVEAKDIYREIDSIIDSYLRRPGAPEADMAKRKTEAVASYFSTVPHELQMHIQGFI